MARTGEVVLLSILVLSFVLCGSHGQGEEKAESTVNDGQDSALERGMRPFFAMTRTFLGLVMELTDEELASNPIIIALVNNTEMGDLAQDMEFWKEMLSDHAGFAACIIVGLLFIIIMPIVGFCFCCCRMCGRCGGKVKPREGRHHKCRQYTCGTILFLCNTVMLIGLVFAFMTNEQLRLRTVAEDGLVESGATRVESVSAFFGQINNDIVKINRSIAEDVNDIISKITNLGTSAAAKINEETNAESLVQDAFAFVDGLVAIDILLRSVEGNKMEITEAFVELQDDLNSWKQSVNDALNANPSCTTDVCNAFRTELGDLSINVQYDQASLAINEQLANLGFTSNAGSLVNTTLNEYREAYDNIKTNVDTHVDAIEDERNKILRDISARIVELQSVINNNSRAINNEAANVRQYADDVETYGTYIWYAGISLCCIMLLIVLCYFLGLMFGACGDPPYDDVGACNKGVGANLLLAGVGFCFLFGWLLMLICMPLYAVGQVSYSVVCAQLSPNLSTSVYLEILDSQLKSGSIVPSDFIRRCEQNYGIYEALHLENSFDIDSFSVDDFGVKDELDKIKDLDSLVNLDNVEIYTNDIRDLLTNISQASLDDLPLENFIDELNKQPLSKNLGDIDSDLTNLRDAAQDGGNIQRANALSTAITDLEDLQTQLDSIQDQMANLRQAVDALAPRLDSEAGTEPTIQERADKLNTDLQNAEAKLRTDGETILSTFFNDAADELYADMLQAEADIKTDFKQNVGRCRPLYEAVQGLVNIVCIDFFNPYNGMWFSFGWVLAFFIPSIIAAVHLAGSYRKTEDYDPTDNKSFDEPNFDAYSGGIYPGDNIPLEDYHGRKPGARGGGEGLPNSAYVSDRGAPPMPPRDYASRDNYSRNGGPPAYSGISDGGYGGNGAGYRGGPTPPNPPHYYKPYEDAGNVNDLIFNQAFIGPGWSRRPRSRPRGQESFV